MMNDIFEKQIGGNLEVYVDDMIMKNKQCEQICFNHNNKKVETIFSIPPDYC